MTGIVKAQVVGGIRDGVACGKGIFCFLDDEVVGVLIVPRWLRRFQFCPSRKRGTNAGMPFL